MDAARRDELKALFEQALALPPDEREAFLNEACKDDAARREELDSLLAHYDEAPAFFDSLAGAVLPHARPEEQPHTGAVGDPHRLVGRTVSHYQIQETLGGGGMGVVYKAHDLKLKRTVALKFLPPELTRDQEAKQRFIHEAQAASALDHVNVGYIHEIDEAEDGRLFIAMAYYAGETLKAKIARGPLPVDEALDYAAQVAQGLSKAHGEGIVHRDIKPANVMVTDEGVVKIVDFGLAKVADQSQLTKTGTTLGTVSYMSPEQARGEVVDERTDLWSLGVVLYEMLAGERPFKGDYEQAVIYSVLNVEPELVTVLRSEAPEALAQVVGKALAKVPEERYPHMDALLADLNRVRNPAAGAVSTLAMAPPPRNLRRRVLMGAGLVVVAFIVGYGFISGLFTPEEGTSPSEREMLVVLPFENKGEPDHAYFADGITLEMTAKLGRLQGLRVISDQRAWQYKASTKTDQEIGRELGVDYILRSTILWQPSEDGASRVRVIPRLIRASDSEQVWTNIFTSTMTDVFEVQASITEEIVRALGGTLNASEAEALAAPPTDNPEAYAYFLRGLSYKAKFPESLEDWLSAAQMFEQAVALDPNYVEAYAQLSRVYSHLFNQFQQPDAGPKAREAVDKAVQLAPNHPATHHARGWYHYDVTEDFQKAEEHLELAQQSGVSEYLFWIALGRVRWALGKWEQALASYQEAYKLDPQDYTALSSLGGSHYKMRRYADAEFYLDNRIARHPDTRVGYFFKIMLYLSWDGDTERAAPALRTAMDRFDLLGLLLTSWDFDDRMVLRLFPDHFAEALNQRTLAEPGDSAAFYLAKADAATRSRQEPLARVYVDSARVFLERRIAVRPNNSRDHGRLGLAYAGLGRRAEAIHEAERALSIVKNAGVAASFDRPTLAEIYVLAGDYDAAIDQLASLLSVPSIISVPLLRFDPVWAPLRGHPRFEALVAERG